jgi:hypothetical protein
MSKLLTAGVIILFTFAAIGETRALPDEPPGREPQVDLEMAGQPFVGAYWAEDLGVVFVKNTADSGLVMVMQPQQADSKVRHLVWTDPRTARFTYKEDPKCAAFFFSEKGINKIRACDGSVYTGLPCLDGPFMNDNNRLVRVTTSATTGEMTFYPPEGQGSFKGFYTAPGIVTTDSKVDPHYREGRVEWKKDGSVLIQWDGVEWSRKGDVSVR